MKGNNGVFEFVNTRTPVRRPPQDRPTTLLGTPPGLENHVYVRR
jgi:hypothetical protein